MPWRFPQDRLVFAYAEPGEPLRLPFPAPIKVTVDSAGTQPAPITTLEGVPISDSVIYTGRDGLIPEFLCTLDVAELWAKPIGATAPPYRMEASYGPRIDRATTGPPGPPGPTGPSGPKGESFRRWYGQGPPGTVIGSSPGDEYVDMTNGDLYVLE